MRQGEMDQIFVVKSSILGVKSRDDGGVHGTGHCYCGAEMRAADGSNKFRRGRGESGIIPGVVAGRRGSHPTVPSRAPISVIC